MPTSENGAAAVRIGVPRAPCVVPCDSIRVPRLACCVTRDAFGVAKQATGVTKQPVRVANLALVITKEAVRAANPAIRVTKLPIRVTKRAIGVTNEAVRAADSAIRVVKQLARVTKQAIRVTNQAIGVTKQPIRVTKEAIAVTKTVIAATKTACGGTRIGDLSATHANARVRHAGLPARQRTREAGGSMRGARLSTSAARGGTTVKASHRPADEPAMSWNFPQSHIRPAPMSNAERQRRFREAHPGYNRKYQKRMTMTEAEREAARAESPAIFGPPRCTTFAAVAPATFASLTPLAEIDPGYAPTAC
ncbi:MAG: hypothetical protein QM770_16805 [Tepidisphaeraceae bacterium]